MKNQSLLNKLNLKEENKVSNLNPWYVTGLSDGDGMFGCIVFKEKKRISLEFKITGLSKTSSILMNNLKLFFNCGRIAIDNRRDGTIKFVVTDLNSIINKIIPHFDNYLLQGSKRLNFLTFKKISKMMENKEHLTELGYIQILEMYGSMNKNRKFEEKFNYLLNISSSESFNINRDWLIGFIKAEGSFYSYIEKEIENKVPKITNTLEIAQSTHELPLLKAIIKFLNIGYLKPKPKGDNLEDIMSLRSVSRIVCNSPDKIINFIGPNPFFSLKQRDYEIWIKINELVKKKVHHEKDGFTEILKLKKEIKALKFNQENNQEE